MEIAPSPAKKDTGILYFLTLVVARALGMGSVAAALPVSHGVFGENYPGDGQQSFGFIVMFAVVGIVAAFVYLVVASIAHFIVRKKSLQTRCWVEVGVFAVFIITLVYEGVTAHYS